MHFRILYPELRGTYNDHSFIDLTVGGGLSLGIFFVLVAFEICQQLNLITPSCFLRIDISANPAHHHLSSPLNSYRTLQTFARPLYSNLPVET